MATPEVNPVSCPLMVSLSNHLSGPIRNRRPLTPFDTLRVSPPLMVSLSNHLSGRVANPLTPFDRLRVSGLDTVACCGEEEYQRTPMMPGHLEEGQ